MDFFVKSDHKAIANLIVNNRLLSASIDPIQLSQVTSETDGYLIQRELLTMTDELGAHVGWKIGATNSVAQEMLKFGPFYGPLFQSTLRADGDSVLLPSLGVSFKASEVEFAFKMNGDLPPLPIDQEYSEAEVLAKVASVSCSIELAASRINGALTPGMILADFGLHGCFALGDPFQLTGDACALVDVTASLEMNGVQIASSTGANVLGNPLTALTWLANRLNKDGLMLQAGQVVMSGAAAASKDVQLGTLTAKLVGIGLKKEDSSQLSFILT